MFDEPGGESAFEMRYSFLYFLLLVRISEILGRKILVHLHTQGTHLLKS